MNEDRFRVQALKFPNDDTKSGPAWVNVGGIIADYPEAHAVAQMLAAAYRKTRLVRLVRRVEETFGE